MGGRGKKTAPSSSRRSSDRIKAKSQPPTTMEKVEEEVDESSSSASANGEQSLNSSQVLEQTYLNIVNNNRSGESSFSSPLTGNYHSEFCIDPCCSNPKCIQRIQNGDPDQFRHLKFRIDGIEFSPYDNIDHHHSEIREIQARMNLLRPQTPTMTVSNLSNSNLVLDANGTTLHCTSTTSDSQDSQARDSSSGNQSDPHAHGDVPVINHLEPQAHGDVSAINHLKELPVGPSIAQDSNLAAGTHNANEQIGQHYSARAFSIGGVHLDPQDTHGHSISKADFFNLSNSNGQHSHAHGVNMQPSVGLAHPINSTSGKHMDPLAHGNVSTDSTSHGMDQLHADQPVSSGVHDQNENGFSISSGEHLGPIAPLTEAPNCGTQHIGSNDANANIAECNKSHGRTSIETTQQAIAGQHDSALVYEFDSPAGPTLDHDSNLAVGKQNEHMHPISSGKHADPISHGKPQVPVVIGSNLNFNEQLGVVPIGSATIVDSVPREAINLSQGCSQETTNPVGQCTTNVTLTHDSATKLDSQHAVSQNNFEQTSLHLASSLNLPTEFLDSNSNGRQHSAPPLPNIGGVPTNTLAPSPQYVNSPNQEDFPPLRIPGKLDNKKLAQTQPNNFSANWKGIFMGELNTSLKLNFYEFEEKDGVAIASPPAEIFHSGATHWQRCLIGQFFDKPPPFFLIQKMVDTKWKKFGPVDIRSTESGMFVFQFETEAICDLILEELWHVYHRPLLLRRWTPGTQLINLQCNRVPIWLKLINVPLDLWDQDGLSYVASTIGFPLQMDSLTASRRHLGYARVCVEMNIEKDFPKSTFVRLLDGSLAEVQVEYTWKPKKCSHCKVFGHNEVTCTATPKETLPVKNVNSKETLHVPVENVTQPSTENEWKTAGKVQKNKNKNKTSLTTNASMNNRFAVFSANPEIDTVKPNDLGAASSSQHNVANINATVPTSGNSVDLARKNPKYPQKAYRNAQAIFTQRGRKSNLNTHAKSKTDSRERDKARKDILQSFSSPAHQTDQSQACEDYSDREPPDWVDFC